MVIELMLLLVSQPPVPSASQFPVAPPPPPPVKEAPKPATPVRIRVGGQVQAANLTTLGATWFKFLDAEATYEQLEVDKRMLITDPDNVCARGRLIAFAADLNTTTRAEHFVWMIQHHPEWDGFSLEPHRALTRARSRSIQEANDLTRQLKTHWLKQIGPEQKSAMVLHNAAMFFAIREPEFAATLLKRAIELDPAEPLYVERLRLVYIGAQTPAQFLVSYGVVDSAERTAFAEQASASLKSDPAFQRYSDPEISPRFRNDSCRVQ